MKEEKKEVVSFNFRVSPDFAILVKKEAIKRELTVSSLIKVLLRDEIEKNK
jgi:hypothetical protein